MRPGYAADAGLGSGARQTPTQADDIQNALLEAMKPAQVVCRIIAFGAFLTGAVMVMFSRDVEATLDNSVVDAVVHVSNLKFMAAMWCVTGAIFTVGASLLHDDAAWRLLRVGCIGISISALVRLVEMVRLDSYSSYGIAAAMIELVVPGYLTYLRHDAYARSNP